MEALIGTVIGAVAALVGAWISAKHSYRAQMNAAVLNTILPARLEAYHRLQSAFSEWGNSTAPETYAFLYQECDAALLVSSKKTAVCLHKVTNAIKNLELLGSIDLIQFRDLYTDLIKAMNHDLMYIQAPRIEKNKPQNSKEN